MSKANTIRKKALEHARRQNWDAAIKEYQRLSEIDQSNPNLFNELGDLYLKTGNKSDAYQSFARAVDAYARVSLYNNAVAVCKKVLRLIPARYEMLAKLGCIRKKQGLARDAESYCLKYLETLAQDSGVDPKALQKTAEEIGETMSDCAVVLDRLAEGLIANELEAEAGGVLASLHALYQAEGITDARDQVAARLETMGLSHLIEAAASASGAPKDGPVITEENIWTDSLSEGERMPFEGGATDGSGGGAIAMGAPRGEGGDHYDYNSVDLPEGALDGASAPAHDSAEASEPAADVTLDGEPTGDEAAEEDEADDSSWDESSALQVSAIIGAESEGGDDDDFRSHYDLGMAYLEMNLFPEAVREYQIASRSPEFQVKSLEMIGLCFLKQNQAHLAVKQLTKGLAQIDENDSEALGIKYNLGLAYEMMGDDEKARAMFEDVYVSDVGFRDVAEKIARYTTT